MYRSDTALDKIYLGEFFDIIIVRPASWKILPEASNMLNQPMKS